MLKVLKHDDEVLYVCHEEGLLTVSRTYGDKLFDGIDPTRNLYNMIAWEPEFFLRALCNPIKDVDVRYAGRTYLVEVHRKKNKYYLVCGKLKTKKMKYLETLRKIQDILDYPQNYF